MYRGSDRQSTHDGNDDDILRVGIMEEMAGIRPQNVLGNDGFKLRCSVRHLYLIQDESLHGLKGMEEGFSHR